MVYQQCGPVCPQTCENQECEGGGCAEGCFCPDGMVLSNSECINKTDCQGNLRQIVICMVIVQNSGSSNTHTLCIQRMFLLLQFQRLF